MVTAQVLAITTEVPREFRDMAMEVITRDLLSLVMVITMDMDNLMFIKTVIIIMDLMDMRLSMITRRDLLSLDMVTAPELAITTEVLRVFRDMGMEVTIRDLPNLDMVTAPELAITTEVLGVFRDMGMEVTIR